ncbi:MAG: branched-chain amino acid ABC transporter permease [Ndongobacter sp.]|nr:branched-chain amino acid ABC transporter permease [Ndongobacter sp.]
MVLFFQQLIIGFSIGGTYALLATGYALIYSLLGFSNWAHGEVAMAGAYIAVLLLGLEFIPYPVAMILGVAAAGTFSVLNEKIAYKRIRDHHSPTMFLMIAAMGLSIVYQNTANLLFSSKFRVFPEITSAVLHIGPLAISVLDLGSLILSVVLLIILDRVIYRSKVGLGIRAVASNSYTASLMGINIDWYYSLVFMIAGFLAGSAGMLLGMKYTVYPTMGNIALKAFISSVLGGLGSVRGAILGAFLIGVLETLVSGYLSSGLRDLFTFGLLIVILLVKPSGLMGVNVKDKA